MGPDLSRRGELQAGLRLSVIIPALNESANIAATIDSVRSAIVPPVDILVVDGGSSDDTVQKAQSLGATVIPSERGRGRQLNAGWRAARGDWCLFLHSDSQLPPQYDSAIASCINRASLSRSSTPSSYNNNNRCGTGWVAARLMPSGSNTHSGCDPGGVPTQSRPYSTAEIGNVNASGCCCSSGDRSTSPVQIPAGPPYTESDPESARRGLAQGAFLGRIGSYPLVASSIPDVRNPRGVHSWGQWATRHSGPVSESPLQSVPTISSVAGVRSASTAVAGACTTNSCTTRVEDADGFGGVVNGGSCGYDVCGAVVQGETAPVWGAFATIRTDLKNPILRTLLSAGVEARTRLCWRPYGDQGLFVRRDVLEAHRPVIVDGAIRTSGRRWQSRGFLRTTLTNQVILLAYALGVSPNTLAEWYRGPKQRTGGQTGSPAGGQVGEPAPSSGR